MTDKDDVRDARLAQALRHMPDAHMQPSAEARMAVLKHAQEALTGRANTAPPAARRWWQSTSPSAWGGALASVLVASFITLMWYGQPVPDANPEGLPATEQEAKATAPAAPAADADKAAPAPLAQAPVVPPAAEKKRETAPRALPPPPPVKEMAAPPVAAQVPQPALAAPTTMSAPAPAPVAAPPAPAMVAKSQAADSALALPSAETAAAPPVAAVAGRMQRSRTDSWAAAAIAATATVTQGNRSTRLGVGPAAALLAALRALPYEVPANNLHVAADSPVFTVQSAQGEVWAVSPHRVVLRNMQFTAEAKQIPQATVSPITDAQWQELRGLAQAAP